MLNVEELCPADVVSVAYLVKGVMTAAVWEARCREGATFLCALQQVKKFLRTSCKHQFVISGGWTRERLDRHG